MSNNAKSDNELNSKLLSVSNELNQLKQKLQNEINARKEVEFLLGERKKELQCQHSISKIISTPKLSVDEVLEQILATIPPAMQFPEITEACICVDNKDIKTPGFSRSKFYISHPISIGENAVGEVIVNYLEDKVAETNQEIFLSEERDLLFSIAVRISGFLTQKNDEKKALENEKLYQSFLYSSPDIVTIADLQGNIIFSSLAQKMFGYPEGYNFSGKNILQFIHATDHEKAKYNIGKMFGGIFNDSEEYTAIKYDGTSFLVEINGDFIRNENGQPEKLIFVTRDISKRKKIEQKLVESEEKYRNLVETINDVLFETTIDGTIKYISPSVVKLFGYEAGEIIGRNQFEFMHPDDIPMVVDAWTKVDTVIYPFLDIRYFVKDGSIKYVRSSFNPIYTGDKITGGSGLLIDITEQKLAEEKLIKSEERYRNIVETINDVVFEVDINGKVLYVSPSVEKISGYPFGEIIGKHIVEFAHPDSVNDLIVSLQDAAFKEDTYYEFKLLRKDGLMRWVRVSVIPVFNDGNLTGFFGSLNNITEIKEIELELRRKEAQHNEAQKLAKLGHWEMDLVNNTANWSEEVFRIFNLDSTEFNVSFESFIERVHPEDQEMVKNSYLASLSTNKPQDIIHRILLDTGEIKFVNERYFSVFNENGIAISSRGTVMDITEQYFAEKELRMFKKAADAASYGIAINKLDGELIYVNEAWAKMHGYEIEELIGKNLSIGHNEGQIKEVFEAIDELLATGKMVSKELWHTRKDGTEFPTLMNSNIITDKENHPQFMSATAIDITELKNAQNEIAKSEFRYRAIFENIQDIYYENLMDGTITEISPSVYIISNGQFTREKLLGTSVFNLYANSVDREKLSADLFKNGKITDYEIELSNADLSTIPVSISASLILDENKQPLKVVGSIRDISERKIAEEKLKQSEFRYRTIFENIQDTYYETSIDGIVIEVSPTIEILSKGQYKREELIGQSVYQIYSDPGIRKKLIERISKTGKVPDFELELKNKDFTVTPVSVSATMIFDENKQPVKISGSIRDISERKIAEEKVLKSELKYRSFFENMQDTYYEATLGGILLEISPSVEILSKGLYKREDLIGKSLIEIYSSPEEREKFYEQILKFGKVSDYEIMLKNRDNSIVPVAITSLILYDYLGQPEKIIGNIRDISERKIAEEKIRQSEEKYRSMFRNNKSVILILDLESGNIVDANTAAAEYYGWPVDALCTKNISEINTVSNNEIRSNLVKVKSNKSLYFNFKHRLANGEIRDVEVFSGPIQDGDKTYLYSIIHDITDRKRAEEALIESEKNLNNSQQMAKMGSWQYNVITGDLKWSENYYALLGIGPSIPPLTLTEIKQIIHPDDRDLFEQKIVEINKTGKIATLYFRLIKTDGELKWIQANMAPIYDANNRLIEIKGISIDITDKKENEEKLQSQKDKLQAVIKAVPDLMFIIDKNGKYLEYFFSDENLLAIPRENIIGKNISELFAAEQADLHMMNIGKCLETNAIVEYEYSMLLHSMTRYFELRIIPMPNDTVLTFIRDITERKKIEKEILSLNQNLENKVEERTKELADKTRELENFFSVSLDLLCITDLDGKFIKVNKAWEDILGYSVAELNNFRYLDFVHPDDLQAAYNAMGTLKNNGKVLEFINRYHTKSGDFRYIEWHSVPVGETVYSAARDVTENKFRTDFQYELLQLSSKLTGIPLAEIQPSINRALQQIGKFLEADRAYIFEFTTDLAIMDNTFEWNSADIPPEIDNWKNINTDTFPNWMSDFKNKKNIVIPSVENLPEEWLNETQDVLNQSLKSFILIPLFIEDQLIGFTGLDYIKKTNDFSESEISILKLWSTMLSGLINNYRVEVLLEETMQNFQTFFNTTDDFLFVIDENGNIIHTNETVKRRLGYSDNELNGQSVLSVHPENRREEAREIMMEMLQGTSENCPVPVVDRWGKEIEVETRVKKGTWNGKPAIFGVTKDISQIKLSEEKFSMAFHTNTSLMTISNINDSRFIEVNNTFLHILDFTREEVIGKTGIELQIFPDLPAILKFSEILKQNESVHDYELRVRTKSGEERIGLFSVDVIIIGNGKKHLTTMVDITDRKKMEKDLVNARNEAEKANMAKSEFLSRMSHELRTPMNSILGFAQLLEMGALNEKQERGVNHILKSGKYLLNMINEVLELSRIELGNLSLSIEPVAVNSVVSEIMDFARPQSEQKNIAILNKSISHEVIIYADKQKLKQILLNLLINAIKYSNENEKVEIRTEIKKAKNKSGEWVRISVTDSGTGISEENIKKLFSPFERLGAEKTKIEGTGLGLAVSKKLTEAMDGKIGVDSELDKGSVFWVEFPLIQKMKNKSIATESTIETNLFRRDVTGTVLYVEDNESNIDLVEQVLSENRPSVKLFHEADGSNAINVALTAMPDLILLDLNLPGMQGSEILEEVMNDDDLKNIPVVIVSANAMPQQIKDLLKMGARNYLTKPINIAQFLNVTDQYLTK